MNLALIVIDVQRGLFEPAPADADAVIERINALSAKARQAGAPVIFVQHERAGDLMPDSEAWALHPALALEPGDHRIRKAHTTHDKPHADAARIREHHNATLPAIRSFGVGIRALPAGEIAFAA